jgi:hypothetical protein
MTDLEKQTQSYWYLRQKIATRTADGNDMIAMALVGYFTNSRLLAGLASESSQLIRNKKNNA